MDTALARHEMVQELLDRGAVRSPRVAEALEAVPRHVFVPPEAIEEAHVDAPLPIGGGQTISAPHMVAMMAEALDVRPGHRVLEVGGGSGYAAAVLGWLASPGGRVVSMERLAALAETARRSLAKLPEAAPVELRVGDGSRGAPDLAPFDRISVAAAGPDLPAPLLDQLAEGGILVAPVGPADDQRLVRATRHGDRVEREILGPVRFVPLVGEHGWREAEG
ncbi:MAG TPA: protein-L-isoaspartate(D-aspartate) O-methyltransferase [Candidatus Thermoplasmatota archaeon]|nr:protein-L-isoaspartate(D-aspartate) O-methyltransferase [Candidatus Thermoplasmatota archaeon]